MHKKLSLTTFILSMSGVFLLGSGFTASLYFFLNQDTPKNPLINYHPVTSKPISLSLNVSSPDDNLLVFESDLLIQGTTSPKAVVILSFDKEDLILGTDPSGNFSITAELSKGVNNFSINAFDSLGNSRSESRTVYYSTEKL